MATAAIKPSAEFAYKLCRGGAAKTEGQWPMAKSQENYENRYFNSCA